MSELAATRPSGGLKPVRRGIGARLRAIIIVVVAMLLALTPFTAILVLGWLVRIMRRETAISMCRLAEPGTSRQMALARLAAAPSLSRNVRFPGWLRGVFDTVKFGVRATLAQSIATLPFGLLLALAWWAGWENSFNKGYEQAWVGPLIALFGLALAIFICIHLPMGFAHHAAEQRLGAIWELRRIRSLISHVRWRYVGLILVTVLASAPVYIAQIVPTFAEAVFPELATAGPQDISAFAFRWFGGFTCYLVLVLLLLRRWAGRLYARAVLASGIAQGSFTSGLAAELELPPAKRTPKPRRLAGLVANLVMAAAWFAFFAAAYVAQFANHAWWNWLNYPLLNLPWLFRPV